MHDKYSSDGPMFVQLVCHHAQHIDGSKRRSENRSLIYSGHPEARRPSAGHLPTCHLPACHLAADHPGVGHLPACDLPACHLPACHLVAGHLATWDLPACDLPACALPACHLPAGHPVAIRASQLRRPSLSRGAWHSRTSKSPAHANRHRTNNIAAPAKRRLVPFR
jgi:hypothetical protein